MTVGEWISQAKIDLGQSGIESPALEAQVLAAYILGVERTWLFTHEDRPFPELAGIPLLARRVHGEPLAYILGYREFYGRRFAVTPDVLIPRQDTETIIEAALTRSATNVLDIGTGSGCIAITLKLERPDWCVTGIDISDSALKVAERNGEDLGAKADWRRGDLFEGVGSQPFDLIVSNPPYIDPNDPDVAAEVRNFEPRLALFAGQDGLDIYRRLAEMAIFYLEPHGELLLEVGLLQAELVTDLFLERGWRNTETKKDLGGIDRVLGFASSNG